MRLRLFVIAVFTVFISLFSVGQAWSCSNPCPPGQHCIQVCMPSLW